MADGGLIDFMTPADVYALMGNALDNALESVVKEAEGERVISLQVRRKDEMVLIHLENRCSREPEFQDGLPVTIKSDKNQHGFGVRSIRYIVEKYDGELFMSARNGRFYLDILFHVRETN
jgi:sensor histidine kinase regulating citrate/malate metabolism